MAEINNPYSWTEDYVRTRRGECIHYMQEMNQLILYKLLVEDEDYDTVAVGLNAIHHGCLVLFVCGTQDDSFVEQIIDYIVAEAVLLIFGASFKFRDFGDEEDRRERALRLFQSAEKLGGYHPDVRGIQALTAMSKRFIRDLESGHSLAQIRRSHANVFPDPHQAIDSICLSMRDGGEMLERLGATGEYGEPRERRYEPATQRTETPPPARSRSQKPAPKRREFFFGWVLGILLLVAAVLGPRTLLFDRSAPLQVAPVGNEGQEEQEVLSDGEEEPWDGGSIFPNSSTKLLNRQDVEALSDSDLSFAINEIYARNGYIFQSGELREYYGQFDWYVGEIPADEFTMDLLNEIERQNCNLLVGERNRRS